MSKQKPQVDKAQRKKLIPAWVEEQRCGALWDVFKTETLQWGSADPESWEAMW